MKTKILYFLVYIVIGFVSYFGYQLLYNTSFDLGIFCDVSTECYEVTKKSVFFNWFAFCLLLITVNLLLQNKFKYFTIIILVLFFNILKSGSYGAVIFLFILNLFVLLFSGKLLNKVEANYWIIAVICMIFIYFFEMFYIFEIFYYNQKYHNLEIILNLSLSFIFITSIICLFFKRKKRNKTV